MCFYPRHEITCFTVTRQYDTILDRYIYHYNLAMILLAQVLFDVSISEDARHDVKWWPVLHSVQQCGGGGGGGHVGCPAYTGPAGAGHTHILHSPGSHTPAYSQSMYVVEPRGAVS